MSNTVRRDILVPQSREQVWQALTQKEVLAEWMYPNDFEPRVGHRFTFTVPGNPKVGFDGLVVQCQVLELEPPSRLVFSWSVGGPVENTQVVFRLEAEGTGTHVWLEHSGFDPAAPRATQALKGAEYGWAKMLGQLAEVLKRSAT